MQRSRKALLERRASQKATSGRNHLYKVSLSLVFVLWGLVFLFSLWISHGHGYKDVDGSGELSDAESNWNGDQHRPSKNSNSADENLVNETDASHHSEAFCSTGAKTKSFSCESIPTRESSGYASPDKNGNQASPLKEQHQVKSSESNTKFENDSQKSLHLSQTAPPGLDEFKSRAFSSKVKSGTGPSGGIIHRVEPGGAEYNYASASKGAKVLVSNKEAKGASNILSRDKDKYLRNPCSVEEKFVIIELSEETLVGTIEIANFEHHSSNLKDFELHGSLVYPTDVWIYLGNFSASNVRHAQRFVLQEPKWVRYLKLNLQSHYGSEFYCTLSVVEVYGVDAVERMLEDLIHTQDIPFASGEGNGDKRTVSLQPKPAEGEVVNPDPATESSSVNHETVNSNMPDPVEEMRQQAGRMPGDTVLKILMQKVRYLDLNLSVLERYVEELNTRYANIFKEYSKEIGEKDILLLKIKEEIKSLLDQQDITTKDVNDLISWKYQVAMQLDHLLRDNTILRYEVERVRQNQVSMENKGIVVFFICSIFSLLAIAQLSLGIVIRVYRALSVDKTVDTGKFCADSSSWFFLLLFCSIIIFILSL
ncbi:hypothetical protein L6164_016850 [Bauhinia variegata]|uniref:Uncharacterized protein n=1 Tax=Bauhinia variegata TaxID=167791 RepID=A0ACB9N5T0_BAUVA|nr:hypothetical protein L6164_016850 [Bauhinia variegata]